MMGMKPEHTQRIIRGEKQEMPTTKLSIQSGKPVTSKARKIHLIPIGRNIDPELYILCEEDKGKCKGCDMAECPYITSDY